MAFSAVLCSCANGPGDTGVVDVDPGAPPAPGFPVEDIGVPNRSTPSLAAEMIAEPNMDGSKRVGRLDAPIEAAAVPSPSP